MKKTANERPAIYVGTWGKYNAGDLSGAWMYPLEYADRDEFFQACRELHADEPDPEFMFQDWEYFPDGLVSECGLSDQIWELGELLTDDAFLAFAEGVCLSDLTRERFEDCYLGHYGSLADYAESIAEECGDLENLPGWIRYHIDWRAVARDLEYDGYRETDGYIFRI